MRLRICCQRQMDKPADDSGRKLKSLGDSSDCTGKHIKDRHSQSGQRNEPARGCSSGAIGKVVNNTEGNRVAAFNTTERYREQKGSYK